MTNRIFVPVSLVFYLPLMATQAMAQDAVTMASVAPVVQTPQNIDTPANGTALGQKPTTPTLLTPEQIQARLNAAKNQALPVSSNIAMSTEQMPIARISEPVQPIGLDLTQLKDSTPVATDELLVQTPTTQNPATQTPTTQNPSATGIDPREHIPDYQGSTAPTEVAIAPSIEPESPGVIQRLYDRLFNDGVSKVPRLKANFYQAVEGGEPAKLKSATHKIEPYANIKAAIEDVTQESVMDLSTSVARLKQIALSAARAVGYYEVDLAIVRTSVGEVDVIIHDLGQPVKVEQQVVEVRGAGSGDAAFQSAVSSVALQPGDVFHHGNYESSKYLIEDFSLEQGYLDGRWLDHSADVILPDNIADVSLIYDTGEQYDFDEVVFFTIDHDTGQLTTDPDKLPVKPKLLEQLLSFKMGDAYNRQSVRALSNDLLATGYFNMVNTEVVFPERSQNDNAQVSFEQSSGSTVPMNEASLEPVIETLTLDDGTMVDVAPIEFSASSLIQDKLDLVAAKARRLYDMPDDRVLAIDNSSEQNRSILGRISDAISSVARAILPDESEADPFNMPEGVERPELAGRKTPNEVYQTKKVPLYIFVASDKPRDGQIGVGWGSDTGVRAIAKFEHNLVNRDGYQAGIELRAAQNQKGAKLYATRPMSHPLNDKLRASLGYEEEVIAQSTNGFDLTTRTLEQSLSRNIVVDNGWNRTYSLRYRLDELETQAAPETWQDLPVNFMDGKPSQEALLAGFALHKTVSDNQVNPMRGYRQQYSIEAGTDSVISDANMVIARAGVSGIYSFGDNAYGKDRAHQLIGSLQGGYIWSDNFENVPYRLRFFAGGDQSIRGYNYNSLSPVSDKGYLTGGQVLALGSAEYNYEFMNGLRLAVFGDVGNAYDKNFTNETKIGAGVGVRWASPVGQVRVDVATGVNEPDNPIKLHFFIGTPF